jgi:hypothetical protein
VASRSAELSSGPLSEMRGIATTQLGHVTTPIGPLTSTRIPLWRLATGARCIVVLRSCRDNKQAIEMVPLDPKASSPQLDREAGPKLQFWHPVCLAWFGQNPLSWVSRAGKSVTRRIERNLTASAGFRSRPTDKAPTRGINQGQRSGKTALKGRTHDCKRPLFITRKNSCKSGAIHT